MLQKYRQWLIGLGVAGSGTISAWLPLAQRSCTGVCGSCGGFCVPGIVLGSWLMIRLLYKKCRGRLRCRPVLRKEAGHGH